MRAFRLERAEGFRVPCPAHGTGDGMAGLQRTEGEGAAKPGADAGNEENPAGLSGQSAPPPRAEVSRDGNGHASSVEAGRTPCLRSIDSSRNGPSGPDRQRGARPATGFM